MTVENQPMIYDTKNNPVPQFKNGKLNIFQEQLGNYAPFVQIVDDNGIPLFSPTNPGYIKESGISSFKTASVTITSTVKELTAGLSNRNKLIVYPPTSGTIYWGTSSVTSSNGAPLKSGDSPIEFPLNDTTLKIYAVSDGTDRDIRVVDSQ